MSEAKRHDLEATRQRALAQWIGAEWLKLTGHSLIPLGRHSSFGTFPLMLNYWYDGKICDLAWWAVGKQIELASGPLMHVIDHAWLAGFSGEPHEPWALITEPYIETDAALGVVERAQEAMDSWLITMRWMPASQSSWNPDHCVPIVAMLADGGAETFIRMAIPWALERLAW